MGIGLPLNRGLIESRQRPRWAAPKDSSGASAGRASERGPGSSHRLEFRCGERPSGCEEFVTTKRALVSVVDDDESVRESLPDLLREFGYTSRVFSSAEEFLSSDCVGQTRCLILDIAMPGMTGPDLQRELVNQHYEIPVVFITAHGGEAVRSRLLEQGAVACLFKPFSDTALLQALNDAFQTG
jgi:CheY-like chemotaxis protein